MSLESDDFTPRRHFGTQICSNVGNPTKIKAIALAVGIEIGETTGKFCEVRLANPKFAIRVQIRNHLEAVALASALVDCRKFSNSPMKTGSNVNC